MGYLGPILQQIDPNLQPYNPKKIIQPRNFPLKILYMCNTKI